MTCCVPAATGSSARFRPGQEQAVAVAGFRGADSLAWSHCLYIDDLSTAPEAWCEGSRRGTPRVAREGGAKARLHPAAPRLGTGPSVSLPTASITHTAWPSTLTTSPARCSGTGASHGVGAQNLSSSRQTMRALRYIGSGSVP